MCKWLKTWERRNWSKPPFWLVILKLFAYGEVCPFQGKKIYSRPFNLIQCQQLCDFRVWSQTLTHLCSLCFVNKWNIREWKSHWLQKVHKVAWNTSLKYSAQCQTFSIAKKMPKLCSHRFRTFQGFIITIISMRKRYFEIAQKET